MAFNQSSLEEKKRACFWDTPNGKNKKQTCRYRNNVDVKHPNAKKRLIESTSVDESCLIRAHTIKKKVATQE